MALFQVQINSKEHDRKCIDTRDVRSAFVVTEQEDREEIFVKAITSGKPSKRIFSSLSGGALYLQFSLTYRLPPSLWQIFSLALYLSIWEFGAPVCHPGLTRDSSRLERVQKVTLAVILGPAYHSYSNALAELNLLNLSDRRESLCLSFAFFLQVKGYIPYHYNYKCEKSSRYQHWFK